MNKEYIVKHNLMEAHKQFMRLSEGPLYHNLDEAGDEDQQPQGQDMPQGDMQGQPMDQPQGDQGMAPQGGQEIGPDMQGGGDMPIGDPGMPEGGDAPMDMNMGAQPPMGDDELDPNVDTDVLDVEDLTQAQEKLNKKQNALGHDLGDVDNRITALLTAVEKMQGSLDKNNSDIESLKAELEKRVPTQTEKLNMQSLKMYPYNVSPNEYWDKKELDGRYQAEGDDENKKKFELTNADVDDYNSSEIEKSFDDELHQTMKDIFKGF
jgi:uncharacterized protein YoxC